MSSELIRYCRAYLSASIKRYRSKSADFVEWVIRVSTGLITPSANELDTQFTIAHLWIARSNEQELVSRIRECLDSILSQSSSTSTEELKKTSESLDILPPIREIGKILSDEHFVKLIDIGSKSLFLLKNSIGYVFIYKDDCYQYIGLLTINGRSIEECQYPDIIGRYEYESVLQWSIKNYSHYLGEYTNDINKYRRLLLLIRSNVDNPNRYVSYPDMTEDDSDELVQLYYSLYLWKGTNGILFRKIGDTYSTFGRLSDDCTRIIPINRGYHREIIDDKHHRQVVDVVINYAHPNFAESVKEFTKPRYSIETAILEVESFPKDCSIIHMCYDNYIIIKPEVEDEYLLEELVDFTVDNRDMSMKDIIDHINKRLNA